jgi:ABC-2 type transport system ATP-binding protein
MIELRGISKKYNDRLVVNDLSCRFTKNRCTGLIGVNGAGKTTILKIMVGLVGATTGEIFLNNEPASPKSLTYKQRIGYLSQTPSFYNWMTGYEFLNLVADLQQLPASKKKERIFEVLDIVALADEPRKKIGNYSGGMKQRLGIAQAFIQKPEILILDEPVSALDPEGRYQIIKLLQELKKETTIILSTHILHDVDKICDDIIIIDQGIKLVDEELKSLKQKYIEPVLKVELIETNPTAANLLEAQSWVKSVHPVDKQLIIVATDQTVALQQLPSFLLQNDLAFLSLAVKQPELEDIFLRTVKR